MSNQMKHFLSVFVVAGTISFMACPAFAQAVTFNFSGTVTSVSGAPFGLSPTVGDPVTGSIAYAPTSPGTSPVAGYIQPAPSGMSVFMGGATVTHDVSASFQVINNYTGNASNPCRSLQGSFDNINGFGPWDMFQGHIYVNGVPQAQWSFIAFSLTDFGQQALGSTALPTALNFLSFSERVGCIYDSASGGRVGFSIGPVAPPAIPVTIDIKPGSFPNSINPNNQGVIPVAILTTDPSDNVTTFDAATVDPVTVRVGPTGTEAAPVHDALEDVDGDGDTDMTLHFNVQDTGIKCGDTSAMLKGETLDGEAITGTDSIRTVACN